MKIFHRFHFSSGLKRMSVLAGYTPPGSTETFYIATVKGAPETLKPMVTDANPFNYFCSRWYFHNPSISILQFVDIDDSYDKTYLGLSRRGARVLALGWKEIGRMSHQQAKDVTRESLESELHFGGFIAISCPLKPDSKSVVKELLNSTHMVSTVIYSSFTWNWKSVLWFCSRLLNVFFLIRNYNMITNDY